MKKKIITLSLLGLLLFSMAGVFAQENSQVKYNSQDQIKIQEMKEIQNKFQNQYQFNCSGECTYSQDNNQTTLQVREQKTYLRYIKLTFEDTYTLNEQGEVIESKPNIWSRLLNRNRISY